MCVHQPMGGTTMSPPNFISTQWAERSFEKELHLTAPKCIFALHETNESCQTDSLSTSGARKYVQLSVGSLVHSSPSTSRLSLAVMAKHVIFIQRATWRDPPAVRACVRA